jgi:hypothetical protein
MKGVKKMERRKLMSLFALGCGVLLLTGCGVDSEKEGKSKKSSNEIIKCTAEMEESGIITKAQTKFVYDKKEEKIVSGTMEMVMDYSKNLEKLTKEEKEQTESLLKSMLGSMCDSFEEEGYKDCSSNFKSGKFDMSMKFDMAKLEETTDGELNVDMTLKEVKEYFETSEEGTKCTIE